MTTYYFHDGRNEVGPLTIDLLKQQKLTRNTPVRKKDTDAWMPAEKLSELKETVAPRKIKRPKDIVPVVMGRVSEFKQQRPKTLYAIFFCAAMLAALSIYSLGKNSASESAKDVAPAVQPKANSSPELPPAGVAIVKDVPVKNEPKDDKEKQSRLRWNKLITATNSNYGIGLLGGIKDLKVIVANRSDYPVEEAIVDVTYIKAGGGVWKAKPIVIHGIPAHESKEQPVPDVGRGKKVTVSLKKLVSKRMKFSYTTGKKITNHDDPYFTE